MRVQCEDQERHCRRQCWDWNREKVLGVLGCLGAASRDLVKLLLAVCRLLRWRLMNAAVAAAVPSTFRQLLERLSQSRLSLAAEAVPKSGLQLFDEKARTYPVVISNKDFGSGWNLTLCRYVLFFHLTASSPKLQWVENRSPLQECWWSIRQLVKVESLQLVECKRDI